MYSTYVLTVPRETKKDPFVRQKLRLRTHACASSTSESPNKRMSYEPEEEEKEENLRASESLETSARTANQSPIGGQSGRAARQRQRGRRFTGNTRRTTTHGFSSDLGGPDDFRFPSRTR